MKTFLTGLLIFSSLIVSAQYDPDYKKNKNNVEDEPESPFNVGIGIGMDYGGLGGKISGFPVKNFGLFAAVGYNLVKAGYNAGGIVRILPGKKVCPIVTGMYGYNGVIVVQGAKQYNKAYYGPTFGGGIELHFSNKQKFMVFELLIPLRPQEFYDDWDAIKANPNLVESTDPLPVAISIGYHFKLQ